MKKRIITMALFVSMTLLAASCQKEENLYSETSNIEMTDDKTFTYSIDGVMHSVPVQSEAEYDELLASLMSVAKSGSVVKLYNANNRSDCAKETITYQTPSLSQAQSWAKDKIAEGYNVTVTYDKDQELYICVATR